MSKKTYVIGIIEAFKIYKENEQFRKVLETGNFVHCEGRFVINHPTYVCRDENGALRLTEYARRHEGQ